MPINTRPSGITVESDVGIAAPPELKLRRRRLGNWPETRPAAATGAPGRRRGAPAAALPTEEEAIVDALEGQHLELVDAIPLAAPAVGSRRRGGAGAPAGPARASISVPLANDESAVVLVERDGVYEWNVIGAAAPAPTPAPAGAKRRRRGGAAPVAAATRSLRFTIELEPATTPPAAALRRSDRRRSLLGSLGLSKVVAYVFRFVARPVLGGTVRLMERQVRDGLVHVTSPDPLAWVDVADDAVLPVPAGRAARVLLLVHGTFSSTVGSFGSLGASPSGVEFLRAVLAQYDLVIGWDHRTLSALPTENAIELAARLERLRFEQPPEVDAIAYSRGGLVLRSLVEHVLPSATLKIDLRRAVFVACTNAGTELARPANWKAFVDRYLNLAAAGARAAALVPGFAAAGMTLSAAIRGLGVFVKVLASAAVEDRAVPGIAAMDPAGDFVREINAEQTGQPTPQQTYYCAVTSEYDTVAALADPQVVPPTLLLKLADKAADALQGRPNDLVVNVDSMTQIDVSVGRYVRERLDFGVNGVVHHCNYFAQRRTAEALLGWLGRAAGPPVGPRLARGALRRAVPPPSGPQVVGAGVSRVVTLRSTLPAGEALARVEQSGQPWIVVERPMVERGQAVTLHYAHPAALGRDWLRHWAARPGSTVYEAFDLHETGRSKTVPLEGAPTLPALVPPTSAAEAGSTNGSRFRAVVVDRGRVLDVIAPPGDVQVAEPVTAPAAAELDSVGRWPPMPSAARRRGLTPKGAAIPPVKAPAKKAMARAVKKAVRRGPSNTAAAKKASPPPRAVLPGADAAPVQPAGADVECHFRAECDDEAVVDQVLTVGVTVSREQLELAAGHQSAFATGRVKKAKPLVVECMPMLRLAMVDAADVRVQIPVPEAGTPAELRFDLLAREPGPAEVRVQVRQGPMPLVTMVLQPSVVAARTGTRRPLTAKAELEAFPAVPRAIDELRIVQKRPTGGTMQYTFTLELPSQRLRPPPFESAEKPVDPAQYVASLYRRIEDRWTEHRGEREAFERDLRAIGAEMFDELIPFELRQLLWQHRDTIRSVQVLSSEPFIPWELVHVRDPAQRRAGPGAAFFGEMGVVRWLIDGYPPERVRVRPGRARYLVPAYPGPDALPMAQQEIALVESRFDAKPVETAAEAVYRLLERPGQFDLLHVACHGLADNQDIDDARLEMPGRRRSDGSTSEEHVLAQTVARDGDLADGEWRPVVVLNACQSLRSGYSLRGIGGFAPAFITAGAGVVVGSAWSIGDAPAYGFIKTFYESFLGKTKAVTLAEATAAARRKAREDGDATWLAYVVYGHPQAVALQP